MKLLFDFILLKKYFKYKIFTIRKINLILMIIVLFLIISSSIVLFVFSMEWYYCLAIMMFLIFQILVLNYESKIIIDRGLIEKNPSLLHQALLRTFSKLLF